jgi:Beta-lactamase
MTCVIRTRLGAAVLAAALAACAICATAAELPADTADYLRKAIDSGIYVGAIVGLVDGDQVTIQSFGKASEETGKAPDANTAFAIGSITKTFTGTNLGKVGGHTRRPDGHARDHDGSEQPAMPTRWAHGVSPPGHGLMKSNGAYRRMR